MTPASKDAISEWFSRLDQAQPVDGRFTTEVLAVAGEFPIYKPPGDAYDNRHDPVRSSQLNEAMVAKSYASEMAQFRATMIRGKETSGTPEAEEESRLKVQYWHEISLWLKTLF